MRLPIFQGTLMKRFFTDLYITLRDFFTNLKDKGNRKILIIACAVIAVILAAAISITAVVKERSKITYKPEEASYQYALEIAEHNYYSALSKTVLEKKGVDKYIAKQYLKEYGGGSADSQEDKAAIADMTDVMAAELEDYAVVSGMQDFDGFFNWFFENTAKKVETYSDVKEVKRDTLMQILHESLNQYAEKINQSQKEEFAQDGRYELEVVLVEDREFTDEETALYIENKSERAQEVLKSCSVKPNKIKGVRKFVYSVTVNGAQINTVNVYMIKYGSRWFVDNTALVY